MPRAALLSLHARVEGIEPDAWEHRALVQLWGPRFNAYVVAAQDLAIFSLGRQPEGKAARRGEDIAERLEVLLAGGRMTDRNAAQALGNIGNAIRYAAPTGRVVIRWEGARAPIVWTVPRAQVAPVEARRELARRYLHVFGPTTAAAFAEWAGISPAQGRAAFDDLVAAAELTNVVTPLGDTLILAADEASFRDAPGQSAAARLLPSGDTFYLLWGRDRELLVPDASRRPLLWTSRVWPGALLLSGEIVGTWRRDHARLTTETWRRLSPAERSAVETEAASLPLPGLRGPIGVIWG